MMRIRMMDVPESRLFSGADVPEQLHKLFTGQVFEALTPPIEFLIDLNAELLHQCVAFVRAVVDLKIVSLSQPGVPVLAGFAQPDNGLHPVFFGSIHAQALYRGHLHM